MPIGNETYSGQDDNGDNNRIKDYHSKYDFIHGGIESSCSSRTERSSQPPLEKVVLARKQCIHFGTTLTALDVIRRWKYGGHEGGHLFYIRPGRSGTAANANDNKNDYKHSEFFGCTPERLFSVKGTSGCVKSEALAGTRPRGSTQQEDDMLLHELLESPKDRRENRLTGSIH